MVYDKSDRWLYRPLSYETSRICNRLCCDRSNKIDIKIRPAITKDSEVTGARSVSISHRSDGVSTATMFNSFTLIKNISFSHKKNSCDYYYSRAENVGSEKGKTVTEKHCRIVDDGTMPSGWKNRISDEYWWSLRTPSLVS